MASLLSSTASGSRSAGGAAAGSATHAHDPARSFSRSLSLQSAASAMHHPPLSSSSSAAVVPMTMSSPSSSSSSTNALGAVEEARRCRYKTGKCSNARSSKRNGQPHQLCLYHRDKANQIQRKFDRQKRQVMRERKSCSSSPRDSASSASSSRSSTSSQSLSSLHRSHLQLHYSQPHQYHHHHHKSPLSTAASTTAAIANSSSFGSVRNVTNFAPRFTSLAAKDLDIYSDSDASSRFSTDSSSSDVSSSSMWADLPSPVSASAFMGLLRLTPVAAPTSTSTSTLPPPSLASPSSGGGLATPTDPRMMITPTATSAAAQGHLSHDEIDFLCSAMLE